MKLKTSTEHKYTQLYALHWPLLLIVAMIGITGVVMLYSVADGHFDPWAIRHLIRMICSFILLIIVALLDIRVWLNLAYIFFVVCLCVLIGVEFIGVSHMGAKRWLDLGVIQIQPSEFMRIALILTLARYYHHLSDRYVSQFQHLIIPLMLLGIPTFFILNQPDLGTAILLTLTGIGMMFLAGVNWKYFMISGILLIPISIISWYNLHHYQKERILTFLDPERDPLGAGYHILQSKIAIGSGGMTGKGFMRGTQSHLNFLPEKHTDFIFTMFAEEIGLVGSLGLLTLYTLILLIGYKITIQARNHFSRLLGAGVCLTLFLYVFVNVSMVTGLLPIVGVPLPLFSYGGTSMVTFMFGVGLLLNVHLHRNVEFSRMEH